MSKLKSALLVLIASLSLACAWWSSHGTQVTAATVDCAKAAVQTEMANVMPAVLAILGGNAPDWSFQLDALKSVGAEAVICAVKAVASTMAEPRGSVNAVVVNAKTYLAHGNTSKKLDE